MNRERKKACSASKTRMGSIPKMFPVSWFSRFRIGKVKEVKKDVCLERSRRAEKFYGEEDGGFWRLSFREKEGVHGRKSRRECDVAYPAVSECSAGPVSYDWANEVEHEMSPSNRRSCGAKGEKRVRKKESLDFSEMVLDLRKTRVSPNGRVRMSPETEIIEEGKRELRSPARRRDGCLRSRHHLNHQQQQHRLSVNPDRMIGYRSFGSAEKKMVGDKAAEADAVAQNSAVKDILEVNAVKPIQTSTKGCQRSASSSSSRNHHDEQSDSNLEAVQGSECERIEEVKLKELSLADGDERKSIYISKDLMKRRSKSGRSSKVKIFSPRTPSKAELCKIRALENLKKTRMKTKIKEKAETERAILESFAVVKSSFDPQRDFRDSMLEMILDKKISRPDKLEELLACYLTLNSDEYHELIIKVFRQVWFDLNKERLDPVLKDELRCHPGGIGKQHSEQDPLSFQRWKAGS